jgi:YHS domain-containing protein
MELSNLRHVERGQGVLRPALAPTAAIRAQQSHERETPMRAYITSAAIGTMMLATAAFAATKGEFNDMCAMGLTMGKEVKTDCSINAEIDGKTYCFGNEDAKTEFMKDPAGNLAKAKDHKMMGGGDKMEPKEKM